MGPTLTEDALRSIDGDDLAFERVLRHPRIALIIRTVGSRLYAPGLTRDDFVQEARIAVLTALHAWDGTGGAERLEGFTALVVKRRLIDVAKAALRARHAPLSQAADLFGEPEGGLSLAERLAGGVDPVELVIVGEELDRIVATLPRLSALERQALARAIDGVPCVEKRFDNGLQRARKKLRAA